MNDEKARPTINEEPVAYERFKLYDITIGRWKDNEKTDISVKHEETVASPNKRTLKKYMKKLAEEKVPKSKKGWRWDENTYEQKGDKGYYVYYEELGFDPIKVVMTRIL